CVEELRPFSRHRTPAGKVLTREAFEALPPELRADVEHPDKPRWDAAAAAHAREDGAILVPVQVLAGLVGCGKRAKLTPRQTRALAETAGHVGFLVEPDARLLHRVYGSDELVALYRPEGPSEWPPPEGYVSAAL